VEVRPGKRTVKGIVHGDLLEVEVDLESEGRPWPDNEWVALFREYGEFPADLEEPRLEHGKLRFEARDDDLERAWTAIKLRIAVTNGVYEDLLAPRHGAEQHAEDARRADVHDRIENAQAFLDSLE
jgi:hypothetical protein